MIFPNRHHNHILHFEFANYKVLASLLVAAPLAYLAAGSGGSMATDAMRRLLTLAMVAGMCATACVHCISCASTRP